MKNYSSQANQVLEREPDPAFKRRSKFILENLNLKGKEKILDVGCGRGFYLKILSDFKLGLDLYGVDLNSKYLQIAEKFIKDESVNLTKSDICNLPFKDDYFDRIIASEILEHIPDDQRAISELLRVLRPGGIVLITVPNKNYPFFWDPLNWTLERLLNWHIPSNIWWLAGLWADHERLYEKGNLENQLVEAGFKIEKNWLTTRYCLPFSHFLLYGIGKNLVEKGYFSSFNRFSTTVKDSILRRLFLWPIKKIDSFNDKKVNNNPSVNIIFKVRK